MSSGHISKKLSIHRSAVTCTSSSVVRQKIPYKRKSDPTGRLFEKFDKSLQDHRMIHLRVLPRNPVLIHISGLLFTCGTRPAVHAGRRFSIAAGTLAVSRILALTLLADDALPALDARGPLDASKRLALLTLCQSPLYAGDLLDLRKKLLQRHLSGCVHILIRIAEELQQAAEKGGQVRDEFEIGYRVQQCDPIDQKSARKGVQYMYSLP